MDTTNSRERNISHIADNSNQHEQKKNPSGRSKQIGSINTPQANDTSDTKPDTKFETDKFGRMLMISLTMLCLIGTAIALIKMSKQMTTDLREMGI